MDFIQSIIQVLIVFAGVYWLFSFVEKKVPEDDHRFDSLWENWRTVFWVCMVFFLTMSLINNLRPTEQKSAAYQREEARQIRESVESRARIPITTENVRLPSKLTDEEREERTKDLLDWRANSEQAIQPEQE